MKLCCRYSCYCNGGFDPSDGNFVHQFFGNLVLIFSTILFLFFLHLYCCWKFKFNLENDPKIFRYVSRLSIRNSASHVILGTQQYKPTEFATNITLNLDNAWGILRCIIDHCMKQPPGKYLLLKDPNKVRILYVED